MEKGTIQITVAGQSGCGKSRVTFLLAEFLSGKGFAVNVEPGSYFVNENEFYQTMSKNLISAVTTIKEHQKINIKTVQTPRLKK